MPKKIVLAVLILMSWSVSGCTAVALADAAASTAIGVTKGAVTVTGKAVGAVIPDGDDEEDD